MASKPQFKFYFQDLCAATAISSFTPSDNGGKQAFTISGYNVADYFDIGDDIYFNYSGTDYSYSIIDILGSQITTTFPYNGSINNGNTTINIFSKVEANPFNFYTGKFLWDKDSENYFYRLKYSGKVKFQKQDYNFLMAALEDDCCKVNIKVYKLCEGIYSLYYRSYVNKTEGTWNLSKCYFETELPPNDKYTCIIGRGNDEINLAQYFPTGASITTADDEASGNDSAPFFEYLIRPVAPVAPGNTYDIGDGGALFIQINGLSGYASDPNTGNPWSVYVREKRTYIYDWSPSFVAPNFTGYMALPPIVYIPPSKVKVEYTRQVSYSLFTPSANDAPQIQSISHGIGSTACLDSYSEDYGVLYDVINDNCIFLEKFDYNALADDLTFQGQRVSASIITLAALCNNINYVTSDFYEINPIGDTPGYSVGINYVTGKATGTSQLVMVTIDNILNPASPPSSVMEMSFLRMMKNLSLMFNTFWFIDASNRLRIEHDSWFANNLITDVTGIACNKYKKEYTYIREEIPQKESFKFKYAKNADFAGVEIFYNELCSDSPNTLIKTCEFTTDFNHVRTGGADTFEGSSIFMFSNAQGGSSMIFETGLLTGLQMPNGHLSWANLHYNYHRHGRRLPNGYMNLQQETFLSSRKPRKQSNQKFIGCCLDVPETMGTVVTEIGTGDATKIIFDVNTNVYEFELNI